MEHRILIQARPISDDEANLVVKCSCGEFLLDRDGVISEASITEITPLVGLHWLKVNHPEKFNGGGRLWRGNDG